MYELSKSFSPLTLFHWHPPTQTYNGRHHVVHALHDGSFGFLSDKTGLVPIIKKVIETIPIYSQESQQLTDYGRRKETRRLTETQEGQAQSELPVHLSFCSCID